MTGLHGVSGGAERVLVDVANGLHRRGYPVTVNDGASADLAAEVAGQLLGEDKIHRELDPSMGGEDFAFMLQKVPGAYLWLGQGGGPSACALHNPSYDFNDELLPVGASLWVQLVERLMPRR